MTDANEPGQKDRSPSYPNIPLETALERLIAFEAHFKRSAARPDKVGGAWDIKAKAYTDRTVAALRYFGLLNYERGGNGRQVVISEEGRKYLRAQQDETKREIVKAAALRPKQIAKFWSEWGPDRPADAACLDELVLKNGFSEAGARDFLKVYDATISFAKLSDCDKIAAVDPASGADDENPPAPKAKVGDYVQWTSDGIDQLKPPRRVNFVAPDGSHLRVHGSMTGIPMAEVTVVDPPTPPPASALRQEHQPAEGGEPDISVLQVGKRLQITADVDAAGLAKLKQMLEQYEAILKLLQ
jgi:hypothetical protein